MKKKTLLFTLFAGFAYLTFSSSATGPASAGNGNRTGSPGSQGTCGAAGCHSGGSGLTAGVLEIRKKSDGTLATKYFSDTTYTVTLRGSNAALSSFGFQVIALKANGQSAGGIISNLASGTKLSNSPSGPLVEHNTPLPKNGSGEFITSFDWTAPASSGNDSIVFYAIINAVNGNTAVTGDMPGTTISSGLADAASVAQIERNISVLAYPSPFNNVLHIGMGNAPAGDYHINVFDLTGRKIFSEVLQAQSANVTHSIYTRKWASGLYLVQIAKDNLSYTTTVLKQ